jgi:hypothetical protein
MGKVERMDQRLPDIGIGLARQRGKPGFDRIDGLADAGEAQAIDDPFSRADLVLDAGAIRIGDGDGGGEIAEGHESPPSACRARSASRTLLSASLSSSWLG